MVGEGLLSHSRAALWACGAAVVAAALSACTGSSSGSKSTTPATPTVGSATPSTAPVSSPVTTPVATTSPTPSSVAPTTPSGGINVTVPSRRITTLAPIPLASTATVAPRVTARIVTAKSVRTEAHGPGEISGPGVRLTIQLVNGTAGRIGLDQTVINVTNQNGDPASPITSNGKPFQGTLGANSRATGVYDFTLPSGRTTKVNVELSYSASAPTVVFSGSIS